MSDQEAEQYALEQIIGREISAIIASHNQRKQSGTSEHDRGNHGDNAVAQLQALQANQLTLVALSSALTNIAGKGGLRELRNFGLTEPISPMANAIDALLLGLNDKFNDYKQQYFEEQKEQENKEEEKEEKKEQEDPEKIQLQNQVAELEQKNQEKEAKIARKKQKIAEEKKKVEEEKRERERVLVLLEKQIEKTTEIEARLESQQQQFTELQSKLEETIIGLKAEIDQSKLGQSRLSSTFVVDGNGNGKLNLSAASTLFFDKSKLSAEFKNIQAKVKSKLPEHKFALLDGIVMLQQLKPDVLQGRDALVDALLNMLLFNFKTDNNAKLLQKNIDSEQLQSLLQADSKDNPLAKLVQQFNQSKDNYVEFAQKLYVKLKEKQYKHSIEYSIFNELRGAANGGYLGDKYQEELKNKVISLNKEPFVKPVAAKEKREEETLTVS